VDYTSFTALAVAAAYLAGSVPFSLLFARLFGLADPRTYGSGNPGATNIARANKTAAFFTLLADAGKGFLPVVLAAAWIGARDLHGGSALAWIGAAAVAGHVFSVFLKFRGGKGVATALGVFAAWNPVAVGAAAGCWLAVFAVCRISAAASITAMIAGAAALAAVAEPSIAAAGGAVALLVIFRHRKNIADMANRISRPPANEQEES